MQMWRFSLVVLTKEWYNGSCVSMQTPDVIRVRMKEPRGLNYGSKLQEALETAN